MRSSIIILIIFLLPEVVIPQKLSIKLSPGHQQRLSSINSGHKRMVKFYRYYRQDSARHIRELRRRVNKRLDSLNRSATLDLKLRNAMMKRGIGEAQQIAYADSLQKIMHRSRVALVDSSATDSIKAIARSAIRKLSRNKIDRELANNGLPWAEINKRVKRLDPEINHNWAIMNDSTASDSVRSAAREQVKSLMVEKASLYPGFQNVRDQYGLTGKAPSWKDLENQVPGLDTLQGVFDSNPGELLARSEELALKGLRTINGVNELSDQLGKTVLVDDLPDEFRQYQEKNNLLTKGKEMAKEKVLDYFAAHGGHLNSAQHKVSELMSKYRDFANSDNLNDAKKHTSMEGRTLFERFIIGGNFSVVSTKPLSLDLSPQLGYRFNTRLFAGIGVNYRYTFGDSIRHSWYVSPANTSFRVFASYDVIKSWFAYVEGEMSGIQQVNLDQVNLKWRYNCFLGAGRKFLVHPKVYLIVTAIYNLNGENYNPLYPGRFQLRMGFQLSELAMRKKQVNYNPNP